MSFTLAQLETKVRERANMENSSFVSQTEVWGYINASYAELYDLLVGQFEDYFSKEFTFTISSGNTASLPSDCYKVRGLDFNQDPSNTQTVKRFMFEERNTANNSGLRVLSGFDDRSYRVMGQKISVLPTDRAQGPYKLWYIPRFTPLVTGTDEMGDVLDFEEYVVNDAAMKCLIKEESDVQANILIKSQLKARIDAMAANRDTTPNRISDTRTSSNWGLFPRGY